MKREVSAILRICRIRVSLEPGIPLCCRDHQLVRASVIHPIPGRKALRGKLCRQIALARMTVFARSAEVRQ